MARTFQPGERNVLTSHKQTEESSAKLIKEKKEKGPKREKRISIKPREIGGRKLNQSECRRRNDHILALRYQLEETNTQPPPEKKKNPRLLEKTQHTSWFYFIKRKENSCGRGKGNLRSGFAL